MGGLGGAPTSTGGTASGGAGGKAGAGGTAVSSSGGNGGAAGRGGTSGNGGMGGASPALCPSEQLECHYGKTSTCHPAVFTFEPGTTSGFTIDTVTTSLDGASIFPSNVHAHGGVWSLKAPITGPGGAIVLTVPLCGTSLEVTDLEGATFSAWVYLESTMPLPYPLSTYVQIGGGTDRGGLSSHQHTPLPLGFPLGEWTHVTEMIEVGGTGFASFGTSMYVAFGLPYPSAGVSPWQGAVYFDDITITPAM